MRGAPRRLCRRSQTQLRQKGRQSPASPFQRRTPIRPGEERRTLLSRWNMTTSAGTGWRRRLSRADSAGDRRAQGVGAPQDAESNADRRGRGAAPAMPGPLRADRSPAAPGWCEAASAGAYRCQRSVRFRLPSPSWPLRRVVRCRCSMFVDSFRGSSTTDDAPHTKRACAVHCLHHPPRQRPSQSRLVAGEARSTIRSAPG